MSKEWEINVSYVERFIQKFKVGLNFVVDLELHFECPMNRGLLSLHRLQNAFSKSGDPVFVLTLLHAASSPLQGFVNAVVYGMDPETRSRLTWLQIKVRSLMKHSSFSHPNHLKWVQGGTLKRTNWFDKAKSKVAKVKVWLDQHMNYDYAFLCHIKVISVAHLDGGCWQSNLEGTGSHSRRYSQAWTKIFSRYSQQ